VKIKIGRRRCFTAFVGVSGRRRDALLRLSPPTRPRCGCPSTGSLRQIMPPPPPPPPLLLLLLLLLLRLLRPAVIHDE